MTNTKIEEIQEDSEPSYFSRDADEDAKVCNCCGDRLTWCESCQMYSRTCCEEYGTCQCS